MKLKSKNKNKGQTSNELGSLLLLFVFLIMSAPYLTAQTFDSGSDGTNGALNLTLADADPDGIIIFDPQAMGLVSDANNAYHFTTINVESGVTVKLRADVFGFGIPVIWLATGDVIIDGTLDLNGENGHDYNTTEITRAAVAGAGGFNGGIGRRESTPPAVGQGPGRGDVARNVSIYHAGGGAGHFNDGTDGSGTDSGGKSYGNNFLIPLLGGSGGAGGGDPDDTENATSSEFGAGGGAGGGAILIASSTQIQVNGSISCNGGNGGDSVGSSIRTGGGGSGGSIRLVANTLAGSGSLFAKGGGVSLGKGSVGRIRKESFNNQFTGPFTPTPITGVPISVFPKSGIPAVRAVRISGLSVPPNATASVDIPTNPRGSFSSADLVIEESSTVTLEIEATDIPLGTSVNLTLYDGVSAIDIISTPLTGTFESSTATAAVVIPSGFSYFTVEANW